MKELITITTKKFHDNRNIPTQKTVICGDDMVIKLIEKLAIILDTVVKI